MNDSDAKTVEKCDKLYHELCDGLSYQVVFDTLIKVKENFWAAEKLGEYPSEKKSKWISDRLAVCDEDNIAGG